MEHVALEHTKDDPRCSRNDPYYSKACMFCDGGLFACIVCKSFEGATTTDCPGTKMTAEEIEQVYAGILNYRNGEWRNEPSRHSPAYWKSEAGLEEIANFRKERANKNVSSH